MREVVNAICYVLRGGIAWRLMPDSFPPWRTVYRWFARLRDDGTSAFRAAKSPGETINHHLVMRDRERTGREASPSAAVIDSQSVKTTESGGVRGGACPRAGKAGPVGWRQEDQGPQAARLATSFACAEVDTGGRALKLQAHAANVQDRDGAGPLLRASRPSWPFVQLAYADAGYQGPRVAAASPIRVEIVRKPEGQVGFAVHARRWVVERFFAWINRNHRLAKDVEATIASAEAFLYAASAILLLRRLAR